MQVDAKRFKWLDAADAHAKEKCRPAQVPWLYRPVAPALAAPELRGPGSCLSVCRARVCGSGLVY